MIINYRICTNAIDELFIAVVSDREIITFVMTKISLERVLFYKAGSPARTTLSLFFVNRTFDAII